MTLKESIKKYALQNAVQFEGKANPGAVIGKLLAEDPKLKSKMQDVAKEVNMIIKEINSLSLEEQQEQVKNYKFTKKKIVKKEGLPALKNPKKVVMRMAPSPSGPMHLGHAYPLSLNSEYCRKYKGKFILRIEDTNPENIYEPAYGMIPEEAKWLTKDNVKEVIIQSDRVGLYYDYAEQLVNAGAAYVCECAPDQFRELIFDKKACPDRDLSIKEQQKRYANMFSSYKPGEAVLRLKTDIQHKNPAMRDFPLMRINEHPHPRTKTEHRVWPLMNLSVVVDDIELGMTHIVRAKDHMDNAKRQEYIYKYLKKPIPETVFVGKINFTDLKLSASKTKEAIQEKKFEDWSDIRLPFLAALKRRGYQPDAFIKYALDVGVSQNDKSVSKEEFFKALNHFNKEVLDSVSNRYFFIINPKEITVQGAPNQDVELDLHPDYPKKGKRKFKVQDKFYIAEEDFKAIKENELIRLMDCLNFIKKGNKFIFDSLEYEKYKSKGKKIIHWLPKGESLVQASLLMPDKTLINGIAEKDIKTLKKGDIVQFERVGFVRLDDKKKLVFWYGHR